jgi:hypothetical protein
MVWMPLGRQVIAAVTLGAMALLAACGPRAGAISTGVSEPEAPLTGSPRLANGTGTIPAGHLADACTYFTIDVAQRLTGDSTMVSSRIANTDCAYLRSAAPSAPADALFVINVEPGNDVPLHTVVLQEKKVAPKTSVSVVSDLGDEAYGLVLTGIDSREVVWRRGVEIFQLELSRSATLDQTIDEARAINDGL